MQPRELVQRLRQIRDVPMTTKIAKATEIRFKIDGNHPNRDRPPMGPFGCMLTNLVRETGVSKYKSGSGSEGIYRRSRLGRNNWSQPHLGVCRQYLGFGADPLTRKTWSDG